MNTLEILDALRAERNRLDTAIAALEHRPGGRGRGSATAKGRLGNGRRSRKVSAATRQRISQMMKRRWRERKSAASNK